MTMHAATLSVHGEVQVPTTYPALTIIVLERWRVLPDLEVLRLVRNSVSVLPEASDSLSIAGPLSVGVLMCRRKGISILLR